MTEIWKDIEWSEGYQVSNLGRVKSLNYNKTGQSKILKPRIFGSGYLGVNLGRNKKCYIHRLVAEAFIPNPNNLPEVNHINEDKTCNIADNLEWVSHKTNLNHGTVKERIGITRKIAVIQLNTDGSFVREWPSAMDVQKVLGFRQGNIWACMNNRMKTAYGYIWKYKEG